MMGKKPSLVHSAALDNAAAFDQRRGGRTMPKDARRITPSWGKKPTKRDAPPAPDNQPGMDDTYKVRIGDQKFGLAFCKRVYKAHLDGIPLGCIADTFDISKGVVNSIIMKGQYGKLGNIE